MKLLVIPICYLGDLVRLADWCKSLITSFSSIVRFYEIKQNIAIDELIIKSKENISFSDAWEESKYGFLGPRIRFGSRYSVTNFFDSKGFLIGEHLILALERYVKPYTIVLGITSYPSVAFYQQNKFVYGLGDELLGQVCFVSTGYKEFKEIDSKEYFENLFSHAVHELGHALHLSHHNPYPDSRGEYCPMATFSEAFVQKKGWNTADAFKKRRANFCSKCQFKLDNPDVAFNAILQQRKINGVRDELNFVTMSPSP
ncbi:hypothetical protein D5085_02195 [Ectothiorhodospiraceae bacterium BW-2]|nr:hypothetical protein D5085_02195 [Ectothiorhodospiraceae bacterium BW-2]